MRGRAGTAAPRLLRHQRPPPASNVCVCLSAPCRLTPPPLAPPCSAGLASKLQLLEGKLLHGEQAGGLDRLAQQAAAQLSRQQAELRQHKAAEQQARQRIAALESSSQAVQQHTQALRDQAEEVTARLQAAIAEHEAAQAEVGDVYAQWERDREELVAHIRRALGGMAAWHGRRRRRQAEPGCALLACQGR